MAELFLWRAHYSDDDWLTEEPGLGFASIDQSRLVALELIPLSSGLPHPFLAVTPDARPIFFRRRFVEKSLESGEEREYAPDITVLGWQMTVAGRNIQSLTAFYADGSVRVTTDQENL